MTRALFGAVLPVGVFLAMLAIILTIAMVYTVSEASLHGGAVVVGIVFSVVIAAVATLLDRRG